MATTTTKTEDSSKRVVQIKAPDFGYAEFTIRGTHPLVIHRFSVKVKQGLLDKALAGKASASKKVREPMNKEACFNQARYISPDGWDGFPASAMRCAMISACRLVSFKMTLAKMSIFVEEDGWDATEPQIPLIRINGTPVRQEDMARVETGQPYVTIRPAYHTWSAKVKIRWDRDQFELVDVTNLLMRVGMQVGIGEGRPDSKHSTGMGWGLFSVEGEPAS